MLFNSVIAPHMISIWLLYRDQNSENFTWYEYWLKVRNTTSALPTKYRICFWISSLSLSLFVILWPGCLQEHSTLIKVPLICIEVREFILKSWGLMYNRTVLLSSNFSPHSIEKLIKNFIFQTTTYIFIQAYTWYIDINIKAYGRQNTTFSNTIAHREFVRNNIFPLIKFLISIAVHQQYYDKRRPLAFFYHLEQFPNIHTTNCFTVIQKADMHRGSMFTIMTNHFLHNKNAHTNRLTSLCILVISFP